MPGKSDYLETAILNHVLRGTAFSAPTALGIALLTSTKGPRANSTAYVLNDTISVVANDSKVHLYKCTTAGTTAAAQSTLYPGVKNEAITDGTAVFTEQDSALEAGTAQVEPNWTGYARVSYTPNTTNWSAPSGGSTGNNNSITYGAPTGGTGPWYVWGFCIYDATSAGNPLYWGSLDTVKTINVNDGAPSFSATSLTITED